MASFFAEFLSRYRVEGVETIVVAVSEFMAASKLVDLVGSASVERVGRYAAVRVLSPDALVDVLRRWSAEELIVLFSDLSETARILAEIDGDLRRWWRRSEGIEQSILRRTASEKGVVTFSHEHASMELFSPVRDVLHALQLLLEH